MNEKEKLIVALTNVISILEKQGCAGIFKTVELKDGTKEKIECIDEIIKYIDNNLSCNPYKLEDLKEEMLVWDDVKKLLIKIAKIGKETIYIEDEIGWLDCYCKFEKNRFYPITKVMEE